MPRASSLRAVAVVVALVGAGACTADDGDDRALVVVTTPILGDVVSQVVGDDAEVEVVMPRGADPHAFEPSARQAASLRDAELVVANGLGLEAGMRSALEAAVADGVEVFEVAPLLDPIPFGADRSHDADDDGHDAADDPGHEDGHEHGSLDPHVWMDPSRMATATVVVADALARTVADLDAEGVHQRAADYAAELLALDAEMEDLLAGVPEGRRLLVTDHDSFGYFAQRFRFEVVGVVVPGGDTLATPGAGSLRDLAAAVDDHDVPAIFTDETVSPTLAEALAAEVGEDVQVVALATGSLSEPGGDADTYVAMMRAIAEQVAAALG